MSNAVKPLVLIIASLASPAAEAQFLGSGFESNITLTQQDLDMIRQTVNQQIHGKPVGRPRHGAIRAARTRERSGS
jgi:hypothetical protein